MILDLDDYYEKITFIQEGYRYVGTVKEDVSARIVARLK